MGLLNPLEIMVVNSQDFFVTLSDAFQCLWTSALLGFFVVLLLLFAALMIHKAAFAILRSFFLGVMVSSYCQELFFNGRMIVGENGTTLGEVPYIESSLNFLFHFAIIFTFIIIAVSRFMPSRKTAPEKADTQVQKSEHPFFSRNIVAYLFLCITIMKTVGFSSTYFSIRNSDENGLAHNEMNPLCFSYVPTTSFSSNRNNIYVFIVDTFDTFWCDDLLDLYPEVKDEMPGFTFYQNNMSQYSNTFPSVCCTLSDNRYDGSSHLAFFRRVWKGENALSVLKENGYQVNLIMDKSYSFGDASLIQPFCDNSVMPEDFIQELNPKVLRRILYHLSLNRISPYAIKQLVPNELIPISNVEYITITCKEQENTTQGIVNNNSDMHLYDFLQTAEFNADCDKDVLTIIHLNGAHDNNAMLAEKSGFDRGDCSAQTLRANFEIILNYIRNARDLGVYDNTTFIIFGDHGQRSIRVHDENYRLIKPSMPALLIKPANAEHAPFKYDRYTGLSNEMFMASVLEFAGIDHQKHGCSYQDIEKSQQIVTRDFFWKERLPSSEYSKHYTVTGDARDFSNWKEAE